MILSTAYLPNIQYFKKLLTANARIEAYENFQKQTFRNRTQIMTADGVKNLTVPIVWNHNSKTAIRDVLIDNSSAWQRTHIRAIRAAYASSAYFDHYIHRLEPLLSKTYTHLFDLNCDLTRELISIFKSTAELKFTEHYEADPEGDFRNSISPKASQSVADPNFTPPIYYQVFGERQPFAPNLSIIDYLFCEGTSEFV